MVPDGLSADWLLVPARTREGLQTFIVERPPNAEAVPSLDVTRKFARMEFDQTRATLVGPPGDHADIWRRVIDDAGVLIGAELIGVSEAANQLALDYAQAREVFGKPLSKFQVTRHKAVDMLREIELARVGCIRSMGLRRRVARPRDRGGAGQGVRRARGQLRDRRVHPGARRRGLHVGLRRALLSPPGEGERPPPRLPGLAARPRRRPLLRVSLSS